MPSQLHIARSHKNAKHPTDFAIQSSKAASEVPLATTEPYSRHVSSAKTLWRHREMRDRSSEEESGDHTAPDIFPLAARNGDSAPHIPAVLVDRDIADERDEATRQRDEALERARQLEEERDAFFRGMTVAESVHALPAGNEEDVATEATGSSSRTKYIIIAGCVSMI
jgi:hypothetical protein